MLVICIQLLFKVWGIPERKLLEKVTGEPGGRRNLEDVVSQKSRESCQQLNGEGKFSKTRTESRLLDFTKGGCWCLSGVIRKDPQLRCVRVERG